MPAKPAPPGKARARCRLCNNELLLHLPSGVIGCVLCDQVAHWPSNDRPFRQVWRPALVEDRRTA